MEKHLDAVVAGHICLDISPSFASCAPRRIEDIFAPGKLTNVGKAHLSTGGAVSNTGIAMALMGFRVGLMARTGSDFMGKAVLDIMESYGVRGGMSCAEGEETSYSIVLSPPGIDRMFLHNPGANDNFGFNDIDFEMVARAGLFHFGYPPLLKKTYANGGAELLKIFREAKKRGASTSLDMSLPDPESPSGKVDWRSVLGDILPLVDVFLPSAEEIFFMLRGEEFLGRKSGLQGGSLLEAVSPDEIAGMGEELINMGAGACVIKCGGRGIYLRSSKKERIAKFGRMRPGGGWAGRELWAPAFCPGKFVSAIGAGDNAAAGFLGAVLKGCSPELSLLAAAACGALNVQVPDALSGIPPWDEIEKLLFSGWEQDGGSPGAGWLFSSEKRLWVGKRDSSGL